MKYRPNGTFTLTQIQDNVTKLIGKRKKRIINYRDNVKSKIKEINIKEEFISHSPEAISQATDWDFILSVSKSKLTRELFKANSFLEHIDLLEDGLQSNDVFALMKISKLQSAEMRTLLLTLFKRIEVDFPKGKLLYVQYNLAPFTAIDQYVESVESK